MANRYFLKRLGLTLLLYGAGMTVPVCAATLEAVSGLSALGTGGTLPAPDLEVKGFSVFGSTNVLTYISTAPGNAVFNGAVQVSSDAYIVGLSTFGGHAVFASSIAVGYVRGLAAPGAADAAANKGYVDSALDNCAPATATAADIVQGKTADIDCDNVAEEGTLAAQTLAVSTDEVKAGVYASTWLSAVDADLAPANIRAGYTIFGHDGTFTADADAAAADIMASKTAYVNGAKLTGSIQLRTMDPANDTMNAGYYSAATLSAVDADLAAGNIKTGVTIFGVTGTVDTAPAAPSVGGAWLLVPGNSSLGTRDFYVQKYEAKNVGSVPTSEAAGAPWTSITQLESKLRCEALGPGYHLVTMEEAQTISRNIESNPWNWTGGSVGSGGLWRGHSDTGPGNSLAADVTGDPDDDPYVGTGNTAPSIEKRVHQLSTGQYIWDWSGNVWDWVDMVCTPGTGVGYWSNSGWVEWSSAALADYEKVRAGPSGAYTSVQNAGMYYGCTTIGNAVLHGAAWTDTSNAGVFAILAGNPPATTSSSIGFRCAK